MAKVRVLIADDSTLMVRLLSDIITKDARIEVVATAANGEECVIKAKETKPQVILMDLEMPVMNGVEAIRELSRVGLDVCVLAVSAYAKPGVDLLEQALKAGAFDFVLKPSNPLEIEKIARQITTNIFVASFSKSKQIPKVTEADLAPAAAKSAEERPRKYSVIGCSTGGKQSLNQILPQLPEDYRGTTVAILHLPAFVVKQYIKELGKECKIPVREIEHDREVLPGHVYIAGLGASDVVLLKEAGDAHPRFSMAQQAAAPAAPSQTTPSIDVLMESAAKLWGADVQGILLSGTGKDGVKGLRHIQMSKGLSLVEDKASASVPQLPQAAQEFGSVDKVLHVKEILARVRG